MAFRSWLRHPCFAVQAKTDENQPDFPPESLLKDKKEAECQDQWLLDHGQQGVYFSYYTNNAAVKTGTLFVYGAVNGFAGQLAVFNYRGGPCYRCLFPAAPQEPIANCAEAGVIGAVAGMIGAAQALEAFMRLPLALATPLASALPTAAPSAV